MFVGTSNGVPSLSTTFTFRSACDSSVGVELNNTGCGFITDQDYPLKEYLIGSANCAGVEYFVTLCLFIFEAYMSQRVFLINL